MIPLPGHEVSVGRESMIINKGKINEVPTLIEFHHEEHRYLSLSIIRKVTDKIDCTLKIRKASIQFLNPRPFAVIGLRRSQKRVFLEFFSEHAIDEERIVKTIQADNSFVINRVNIALASDIDTELVAYILHSDELIN